MITVSFRILKWLIIPVLAVMSVCACSDGTKNDDIILTINNFSLTKNEFEKLNAAEMEYKNAYKTSKEAKQNLLEKIIKKELLIQEAQKQGIDKDEKFMAAIEKYWEATLIKHLMERKNQRIHDSTTVTNKEIKKRYALYKQKNDTIPALENIEKEIAQEILEEKKTLRVEKWLNDLHENARIKIETTYFNE